MDGEKAVPRSVSVRDQMYLRLSSHRQSVRTSVESGGLKDKEADFGLHAHSVQNATQRYKEKKYIQ